MKAVIVGCGRVGAAIATTLDAAGHEVIILDVATGAFDRLPPTFGGTALRGDGTDEDVLRRAGAEGADLFLSLTEGDNRNCMAAQVAVEEFGIPLTIAKVNDPVRAEAYSHLGVATVCRTNLMADSIRAYLGLPVEHPFGILAPSGTHPGGAHHGGAAAGAVSAAAGQVPAVGPGVGVDPMAGAGPAGPATSSGREG
jgi:trk system potassium uptake protein TrkA